MSTLKSLVTQEQYNVICAQVEAQNDLVCDYSDDNELSPNKKKQKDIKNKCIFIHKFFILLHGLLLGQCLICNDSLSVLLLVFV